MTIAVGFTMAIVYMVMDYGIFHLIYHSRSILDGYSLFWVLLWILSIGILVQFGWEAGLLLGGIRSAGFATTGEKLLTLTVNSLLETNLGMPYVYLDLCRTYRQMDRNSPVKGGSVHRN